MNKGFHLASWPRLRPADYNGLTRGFESQTCLLIQLQKMTIV